MSKQSALSNVRFDSWNLESEVLSALSDKGWNCATQIQAEAIPLARKGLNVVGQAKTGSGKTAAFGIPCIESTESNGITQAIIITPTRELAQQVSEELRWLQGGKGLRIETVYGGTDIDKQAKKLDEGVEIIVGTPGRIIDMTKRGHIKLDGISTLCLDEADRMLDMGFFPDIIWVLEKMDNRKQTMLFSATFPEEVLEAANTFITDAEHVMSDDMDVEIPEIEQMHISIGRANKLWALGRILVEMDDDDQMMVFTNTKRMVDLLVQRLNKFRFNAVGLHGDMPQKKRQRIINSFKDGQEKVLICTDVAARGIDVDGVTIIVNYDLPDDVESYVHRIGRTGRMGRKGTAWSFVSGEDKGQLQKISATWNLEIPEAEVPELPEGVTRDPVKRQQDWVEVANNFGMVPVKLSIGREQGASNHSLTDWFSTEARLNQLAIGEVTISDTSSEIEIHLDKVESVIKVMANRKWDGNSVDIEIRR
ncbi:MAG: ATP-dependent RNA helicase [Euryarchaeota archaeon]|nr:ATP-dependent RNA helicase [Euryarchaeota archaeon]MDP6378294.1 DEAD/DEAH box helicase [Candidatus Thalassarchaeaceae archaeon]